MANILVSHLRGSLAAFLPCIFSCMIFVTMASADEIKFYANVLGATTGTKIECFGPASRQSCGAGKSCIVGSGRTNFYTAEGSVFPPTGQWRCNIGMNDITTLIFTVDKPMADVELTYAWCNCASTVLKCLPECGPLKVNHHVYSVSVINK